MAKKTKPVYKRQVIAHIGYELSESIESWKDKLGGISTNQFINEALQVYIATLAHAEITEVSNKKEEVNND